ncbi:WD40/YVTN/BNR-like repeat-containing protein [Zavarzinia sp.]|uniref:WD40/YVTN/BNR-like repeat-containing protein n=1 Tax=Zavarzinia sp. TaxID=2027920 RepID=UPI00356AA026
MLRITSTYGRGILAACCLLLAAPAPAGALETAALETGGAVVPDLLDLPARISAKADKSLQLAVARAGERLVSVGEDGNVLLSDDNGATWRQAAAVPVSVTLTDVTFPTPAEGWAVGHSGVVLHSADAGETWKVQLDGRKAAQLVADEAAALAASGAPGAEAAKRNAAAMVADGPDKPFLGLHFADAKRGWVVGAYGLALETTDGGQNWQSATARLPNPAGKHLYWLRDLGTTVVVVGEQGTVFRSTDGGASFEAIETPYEGTFFGAVPLKDGGLLAFGLKGNAWRSGPDLADWHQVELGQPVTVTAGLRLGDGTIVLGDEGGRLFASPDDGAGFKALGVPAGTGLTGLAQAADGALILSGTRGDSRAVLPELSSEAR